MVNHTVANKAETGVKMKIFISAAILLVVTALPGLSTTALYAQPPSDNESTSMKLFKGDKNVPLIITSNQLSTDNKNKTATFTGSVKAVKGETTFYADKMVVYYTDDQSKIKQIDATGNTKLIRGEKIVTAAKTVYFAGADEHVVFTGNPVATEGKNTITGTKMTYYMSDDRSVVENSRAHLEDK
ncbi:MAG: lipopolysaccharide transport periplasmic protein LptA [Nitrospirae bacterium]|nr:lipopolysaccharide transport periplasmic protein LptA [Nitrospirota bacterium]MBF0533404.1 lipopolysaccharide transport periplasmic protein LptA [Nitrospirota bacterium]MBF0616070.1 lipopolysaccharide transport periplasmic protein LptA [Nitrospirota bacterium]